MSASGDARLNFDRRALRHARTILVTLIGVSLCQIAGCQKKTVPASPAEESNAKSSQILVRTMGDSIQIQTPTAEFDLMASGYLKAKLKEQGQPITLDDPADHGGQQVTVLGKIANDFSLNFGKVRVSDAAGKIGRLGKRVEVDGSSPSVGLAETIAIEVYDDFPGMALLSASFQNTANRNILIDNIAVQAHRLNASLIDPKVAPHKLWAFSGASLEWGQEDVFPIPAKFSRENPFSTPVPAPDDPGGAGGGIPVVAFWTSKMGEAIGHIETLPFVLSMPVQTAQDGRISVAVRTATNVTLQPGEIYSSPRTFVAVYKGDFYEPLQQWSNVIEREGLSRPESNNEDYAVSWCGWGYKSDVTPKEMLDTIPKLKELGIHWATLDDRWFDRYGDWKPRPDTFPGTAIQEMVKNFHAQGIKVQIWWLPLLVEDGHHGFGNHRFEASDVVRKHPDWLILGKDGKPVRSTRNLAMLCPAVPEVQAYYKHLTELFIRDWDFDGHKLDNIFATPLCYNPSHHHKSPTDSVYAMGEIYKLIFETTRSLKPNSVTQSCPCGTPPSLAWFRYMDQGVTGDPLGSGQVRERIKMYKAILGPRAAVYGDHVELTRIVAPNTPNKQDLGEDFASTLGTGGVLGTKFTWPNYGPQYKHVYLTPEKETHWKKWIVLYNEKMLSKGTFRNLYIYGYDSPEAYAIEKDGKLYYAFYAPEKPGKAPEDTTTGKIWQGELELRGLQQRSYNVVDYLNGVDFGVVSGPTAKLKVRFTDDLLLEATPVAYK